MTFTSDDPPDFTLTECEDDVPTTHWYWWLLFPFWLCIDLCKGFYTHILKPDPPDWREKKAAKEARQEKAWAEDYRRKRNISP